MQKSGASFTVLFQDPFWVGIYQRWHEGQLEGSKIVFGAEPKDSEVYQFLLENWHRLRFSPPVEKAEEAPRHGNPKQMQRKIKRQLAAGGLGTKSQQALQLQREMRKLARRDQNRQQSRQKKEEKFALRQKKRKEKHRGR